MRFWGQRSRSKVMGVIMYAKIICDRIIIRADGWINIKLKTCMYLAELANELSRFWGHEVKDQRVIHVYEK